MARQSKSSGTPKRPKLKPAPPPASPDVAAKIDPVLPDKSTRVGIGRALGRIPQGVFILTARFEDRGRGIMVSWVQQVSFEPPLVAVSLRKGRHIVPIIHDSHSFALCQVAEADKLTLRKFGASIDIEEDPFQSMPTFRAYTGSPIISKCLAYLDCELLRHIDMEADHDLYIGLIRAGDVVNAGEVIVRLREDGFCY